MSDVIDETKIYQLLSANQEAIHTLQEEVERLRMFLELNLLKTLADAVDD